MKFFFVMCLILLPFTNTASAQSSTADSRNLETSGECSPISPDNQGTITIQCTGLSERQSKLILDLLRKISSRQSGDRDALMSKLDEVLATVKEAKCTAGHLSSKARADHFLFLMEHLRD
jgi:hypothetical protein